jgi:hypothetical protein
VARISAGSSQLRRACSTALQPSRSPISRPVGWANTARCGLSNARSSRAVCSSRERTKAPLRRGESEEERNAGRVPAKKDVDGSHASASVARLAA